MIDYRAYIVGADGHSHYSKTILAEDDDHALKVAEQLVDGHDVELWQLDRKTDDMISEILRLRELQVIVESDAVSDGTALQH